MIKDEKDMDMNQIFSPPKYEQLQNYILRMIQSDDYPIDSKLKSEEEYARMFNISRGTVRQAIRNLEKDGILEIMHGKGTFVRRKTSFLKTRFVSFILSETYGFDIFSNSFYMPLLAALERSARLHNIKIVFSTYSMEELKNNPEEFMAHVGNGCFFTRNVPQMILDELDKNRIPYVFVGNAVTDIRPYCVMADNVQGAYLATKYLLDLGHRRIAHLTHDLERITGKQRMAGYRRALTEMGIALDPELIIPCHSRKEEDIYEALKQFWGKTNFTAIFAGNDHRALSTINFLREKGVRIPEDISIIGFDNTSLAGQPFYSLTTIDVNKDLMAQKAVELMVNLLEEKEAEDLNPIIPVSLIIRSSCKKI